MSRPKGFKHSKKTKRKIGNANKISLKGHIISRKTKRKIGNAIKGEKNHFFGKHHSKKTKLQISKNRKGKCIGLKHPYYGKFDYGKMKFKRINGKLMQLSNIIWCKKNQIYKVPFSKERNGGIIHHIDGNLENNNLKNLQLMTKDFHTKLHHAYKNEKI
jgi:hypothetical protein